jgi:hypothetical protein
VSIERILVAFDAMAAGARRRQRRHASAAIRLRDEPVRRRADIRIELRPVDLQITARLVDLVLHAIGRHDLDEARHDFRRAVAERNAVPGMAPEEKT